MNEKTSKSRLTNFINTEFRKEPKDIIKTTTLTTTTTTTGTRQDDPDLGYQYHGPTPVTSVLALEQEITTLASRPADWLAKMAKRTGVHDSM